MTLQGTNTYIVGSGSERLLIDAGEKNFPEYCQNLKKALEEEKCGIKDILVTHWHHDHIGGVPDVLKSLNKTVPVHKFPRSEDVPIDNVSIFPLSDGDVINMDGASCRVLHTPGHTTDHVILYLEQENAVFSADCILGEGTAVFESLYHYMKSLELILSLRPSVIYPGHGPVIEDPIPKIEYYIKHRLARETQILEVLQSTGELGLGTMDIVRNVYKETPEKLWKAAEVNVKHHLEKLEKENKVFECDQRWKCQ